MTRMRLKHWLTGVGAGLAMLGLANPANAGGMPVSGMPVPELNQFDQIMTNFMTSNNITAGVLGIMKDGKIVYQHGFGWQDSGQSKPLRHDAMLRIASCSKPITAAATKHLIADGFLDPNDFVFNLGQPGGGLLNYAAWPSLGDARYPQIRLWHLYAHMGGWDRNTAGPLDANGNPTSLDWTYSEVTIANAMGVSSPPGRVNTARFIMGTPLQVSPGTSYRYSNIGFMLLGLISEQVTGMNHIDYAKQSVFAPMEWMPLTEVVQGRTFSGNQNPREPWYDSTGNNVVNVFDPNGDPVPTAYGGWHHEARIAQGGFVVSTTPLLHLLENYYVNDGNGVAPWASYGTPTNGVRRTRTHNGSLPEGTNARIVQRSDGVNYVVLFNKKGNDVNSADPNNPDSYNVAIKTLIDAAIDGGGFTWPTQGIDGTWADVAESGGEGSYEEPWGDVDDALAAQPSEGTLNFRPGTSDWTGVINQRVRLRSPQGSMRLGLP
ncbi:MAG: beta-lactamase family protein [Phycisphaerales bacterium]|nr:beta-lactamase family protein [Phycisphaerales bacterium]